MTFIEACELLTEILVGKKTKRRTEKLVEELKQRPEEDTQGEKANEPKGRDDI